MCVKEGVLGGEVVVSVLLAIRGVDDLGDETHPIVHQLVLLPLLHWLKVKLLLATIDGEGKVPPVGSHPRILCLEIEGSLHNITIPEGKFEVLQLDLYSFALDRHRGTEEKQAKKPSV